MPVCRRCGSDNLPGGRYCSACGGLLAPPAGGRAERKVVTAVFVDLVGFTHRAERLDPEEVGGLLAPFHERVRAELERFGGTVEKFIGDAVMAVFGAPVGHEDDPERAVRAAFAVREAIDGLNASDPALDLHVRTGVATGEAYVQLEADPARGDANIAGDVVNTAARLQQTAPVDAIVVGEATHRATSDVVDYRRFGPVSAKGKESPVLAWEAVAILEKTALSARRRAPLVGRTSELELLRAVVERARAERSLQVVSLVGEAGIGKSRLAWELHEALLAEGTPFVWRHGRSLPYGRGVTFWALSEVVKSEAGILETDSAGLAERRLQASVRSVVEDRAEASQVERHLRPLVGLGGAADERREAFAAWRRYLSAIAASSGLLVLGLEDLQWADDGLLEFVEHLIERGEGPVALVCTARPELVERRPGWPGVVRVEPLEPMQTVSLLGTLLAGVDVRGDAWPQLLALTGGNPLYAEEYARMVKERPREDELPLPESVQAIISARIDALAPDAKALLQAAAVLGKGFWPGAVEHIAGVERADVERLLEELDRKGLVHGVPTSAIAGEPQHVFSHVLIRDIVYGQIPRSLRAGRHRLAGEWVSALAPDRAAGTAEMTAHHYRSALEYARLARQSTAELAALARTALRAAGDHAAALGAYDTAAGFYEEALGLWPEGGLHAARARLALGTSRFRAEGTGAEELERARAELAALGEPEEAAEAEVLLAELRFRRGDVAGAFDCLEATARALADGPPSRQRAHVLSTLSRFRAAEYQCATAIELGRQALDMATELGLDEIRAHALNNIGYARVTLGDRGGVADLEQSVRISVELGSIESLRGYLNLGTTLAHLGDLDGAFSVHAEGRGAAERLGDATGIRWFAVESLFEEYWRGRWDPAAASADLLMAGMDEAPDYYTELGARTVRCWIRLGRGDLAGSEEDATRHVALARDVGYPQALFPALALGARVVAVVGRRDEALDLAGELLAAWRASTIQTAGFWTADLAFALAALDRGAELLEVAGAVDAPTPWLEAAAAFAAGDAAGAADRYSAIGSLPDAAYARLRSDRPADADGFVRRVGADGYRVVSSPSS